MGKSNLLIKLAQLCMDREVGRRKSPVHGVSQAPLLQSSPPIPLRYLSAMDTQNRGGQAPRGMESP